MCPGNDTAGPPRSAAGRRLAGPWRAQPPASTPGRATTDCLGAPNFRSRRTSCRPSEMLRARDPGAGDRAWPCSSCAAWRSWAARRAIWLLPPCVSWGGPSCSPLRGLRAPEALNAGRGGRSRRARRRDLTARLRRGAASRVPRGYTAAHVTARACRRIESCERAHAECQPPILRSCAAGGWHAACATAGA
jgi:hypothetical protein